jgi:RsiW-degrading membrane proteinase PrsW (M82 family)
MIVPALPAVALAVLLATALFVALWLDRYRVEPLPRLVLVACWGLLCALVVRVAGPAPVFGAGADAVLSNGPAAPPAAGVVVEFLLALGLALVATSRYLDGPLDGAVYGTTAGLGFAAFASVAASHSGWAPSSAALPLFTTLVWAAVTAGVGWAIGFAKLGLRAWARAPFALAAVACAGAIRWALVAGADRAWIAWGGGVAALGLVLVAIGLVLLAAVFWGALALEGKVIARQLTDEVSLGVLPPWVAEVLPSFRRRIRSDWWRRRDERREIVRLLAALAFRKHQLRGLSEERARLYGLEVGRLRQRARTLLALPPDAQPTSEA